MEGVGLEGTEAPEVMMWSGRLGGVKAFGWDCGFWGLDEEDDDAELSAIFAAMNLYLASAVARRPVLDLDRVESGALEYERSEV